MNSNMNERICRLLCEVESQRRIRVLYACESGSRAWGFSSDDSDYDVRFIYVNAIDWYLSIEQKRDTIERPITEQIDLSGWDLRKALQLFRKSNPPLMEWLGSPIVYVDRHSVASRLRGLSSQYYSRTAAAYHYLQMARGNYREYCSGERVWLKKYFYVLRPILAIKWIEKGLGVVPTEFSALVDGLSLEPALKSEIDRLQEAKRAGAELDHGPPIVPINEFLESELQRLENATFAYGNVPSPAEPLNDLFRAVLQEVWSGK